MSARVDADIAVVGGGMVGAAAALALVQAGFSVLLLEAGPAPQPPAAELDLRVVALAPSSARLLAELGVWAKLDAARLCAYRAMHVRDADSGAELDFDSSLLDAQCLGWIAENRLLQWALWQALDAAGVRVQADCAVRALHAQEGHAELELADGRALRVRLALAADGRDSPLRSAAGIAVRGRDYAQRALVAHLHCARPHRHAAWQRFLPGGPLALLPLADGRVSLVWSLPNEEAQRMLALDEAAFAQAVGAASDFCLGVLQPATPRAAFPLRLAVADAFAAPRLALLGDAAHAVHPLAGQGVNMGLRDVAELRAVLRAAHARGADIGAPAVLARYARRRRSADAGDAWGVDALARVFAWQAAPLIAARALGVAVVQRSAALKRAFATHAAGLP